MFMLLIRLMSVFKSLIITVLILLNAVLHQLDQKIIYPHHDFKHLTEKYFEIVMGIDDFLIQLVKYCIQKFNNTGVYITQWGSLGSSNGTFTGPYAVLHQLDQKIIYPHYDFKHLTKRYFEIGMKLNDFSIQLVKYCIWYCCRSVIWQCLCC